MKLKTIKAYGFKSFADKIEIEIKSNITAIVGPNGSGKSNIVDAVRWVLGSQSIKSLRATGAMTDCIFAGSKTREPLKRAEVALTFDNEDHKLNSDLNEIEVKRVLYHTGENEYYINNTKVRLKDVTDLFIDTGIGLDSFNIISQGHIESVITSKPEERRVIFEEAAGVLKYKKRKEESLKKLEKTKDNIEKVDLIINELEETVLPLKEQSALAKKYLELKSNLEELEIAFIASNIKNKNEEYQTIKNEVENLEQQVLELTNKVTMDNSKIESLRLENLKLDEEISKANATLISITEKLSASQSEKEITMERQKYTIDKEKIHEEIINLKEEELTLQKEIELMTKGYEQENKQRKELQEKLASIEEAIALLKVKQNNIEGKKNEIFRETMETKNQIEIMQNNINGDLKLPVAVKNILNNLRLEGICGTIGKLIETSEKYSEAIEVALGASSNFIVVETEQNAKKAIAYLKENHLGRATFFPRNIIKGKLLDAKIITSLQSEKGYIDIASNLIKYDEKYQNIIENQLGNIIVVDNIDTMNHLAKKLEYRYRIVTLTGEIQHTGGSISGGANRFSGSVLKEKIELEKKQQKLKDLQTEAIKKEKEETSITQELLVKYESRIEIEKQLVIKEEEENLKKESLEKLQKQLEEKQQQLKGTENLQSNKLDEQLIDLLKNINKLETESDLTKKELKTLKEKKDQILEEINVEERAYREKNSKQNQIEQELKQKEINLGKLDIQLDNLLLTLSENYNLTYEKAILDYPLDMDYNLAKEKVNKLKSEMESLGTVNLGSIDEYNRLNTRYSFLQTQKEELEKSSEDLQKMIQEMDEIMIEKFKTTFDKIKEEFASVFQKLFKGGTGLLKLTDPDNLLETGIEIIAEPPGKKLNNINLLSGGEKTLTAIALLFAILNVRPVPFCILDEVEAALDEANVDTFGSYLQSKKGKSEFIIITHKKRTMEYADTLYGITMQESGVSKIVSVKLENI